TSCLFGKAWNALAEKVKGNSPEVKKPRGRKKRLAAGMAATMLVPAIATAQPVNKNIKTVSNKVVTSAVVNKPTQRKAHKSSKEKPSKSKQTTSLVGKNYPNKKPKKVNNPVVKKFATTKPVSAIVKAKTVSKAKTNKPKSSVKSTGVNAVTKNSLKKMDSVTSTESVISKKSSAVSSKTPPTSMADCYSEKVISLTESASRPPTAVTHNYGDIIINAVPSQNAEEIAQIVIAKMNQQHAQVKRGALYDC
ncbi:MAG: hypothetical protein HQL71_12970, partial [Magnetococcales bacterium]|nr:hypothetical protein [Magnetococcales bacterium]